MLGAHWERRAVRNGSGPLGAVRGRSEGAAGRVSRPAGLGVLPGRPVGAGPFGALTKSPPLLFFLINCQCFFPVRTCSIWQQESTVGLAGTVVQSLEEFRIVTTHQNKLLSTDQNTKCCDSV